MASTKLDTPMRCSVGMLGTSMEVQNWKHCRVHSSIVLACTVIKTAYSVMVDRLVALRMALRCDTMPHAVAVLFKIQIRVACLYVVEGSTWVTLLVRIAAAVALRVVLSLQHAVRMLLFVCVYVGVDMGRFGADE
mmetsp:Transcript_64954/g.114598  ORF Transcript_64954/g.114598 Transcript_64954/m.114598 type:complete len:135 (-) Transcript_64954:228-632(-)